MSLASETRSLTELVDQARDGRRDAWDALVSRLERVVWKSIRTVDMSEFDRENAFQNTWLKLFESLHTIVDPERLPGWLATTARHEALRIAQRGVRERATDRVEETAAPLDDPDHALIEADLAAALRAAFAGLSPRCQQLLRMLTCDPPLTYAEIADLLGRDAGYIGPTRGRCLDELRRQPALAAYVRGHR